MSRQYRPRREPLHDRTRRVACAPFVIGLLFLLLPASLAHASGGEKNGVDQFYGSFDTDVPIAVPAFHQIEPTLKLMYSSTGQNGFAGIGWALTGASYIGRSGPDGGAPAYGTDDTYDLDGAELMQSGVLGGTHSTKIQNYHRISFDSVANAWYVWRKDGTKATYEAQFQTSGGTFRWAVSTIEDTRGNTVSFDYWCDGSPHKECYLDEISYNQTQIKIYREARPDIVTYANGVGLAETQYRLKSIDVKVSGIRTRVYKINYAASSVTERSLLSGVQQFGQDAIVDGTGTVTGGTSLPVMEYGWTQETDTFAYGVSPTDIKKDGAYIYLGDFNGDGRTDVLRLHQDTMAYNRLHLAQADGTFVYGPNPTAIKKDNAAIYTGDFNGDGRTDVLRLNTSDQRYNMLYLGNEDGTFSTPTVQPTAIKKDNAAIYTGDFNGDGRTDVLRLNTSDQRYNMLYLANEDGTFSTPTVQPTEIKQDNAVIHIGDFNGDGRTDVLRLNTSNRNYNAIFLSNGDGTFSTPTVQPTAIKKDDAAIYLGDFNGDGRTDVLRLHTSNRNYNAIFLSNGDGTFSTPSVQPTDIKKDDAYIYLGDFNGDGRSDVLRLNKETQAYNSIFLSRTDGTFVGGAPPTDIKKYGASIYLGDVDGDGATDVLRLHSTTQSYNRLHLAQGGLGLLVNSTANGLGGTKQITYKPSSAWQNGYLPVGMVFQTASAVTIRDGRGASSTTSYTFDGGLWSDTERRFLGFAKVTAVLDAAGNYTETYYHQHVGCISKPEVTYYRNAAGDIYRYSTYGYSESATAPYTSLMTDRWEYECSLGTDCRRTLLQIAYDQYGNGYKTYEYGDYDVAGDERTSLRGVYPNAQSYIVGMPAYENIYEGIGTGGQLLKQTLFEYDGNNTYAAAPIQGLMTRERAWENTTGGYVVKTFGYDASGYLTSETEPGGATTTMTWDALGRKTSTCNELGYCSYIAWEPGLNLIKSETDINGGVTTYTHDALGRPVTTSLPDGTTETMSYLDWGNPSTQRIRKSVSDGTSDGMWTEIYEDGLGRPYKTVKEGGRTQVTVYSDASKRVWKKSTWFLGTTPVAYQYFAYDGLGRVVRVTNPDSSSGQTVYGNDYVAKYDELGHETVTWTDAYGQTSAVQEKNGSALYVTSYEHDLLGNLTSVTDQDGNTTTITWDSLNRKVMGCDPDTGCNSYTYDAAGQVYTHTNAKGQVTDVTYDELHRPLVRTSGDGSQIIWAYDQAGHGASKGKMTSVTDSSGTESRNYDSAGRVTSTTKCVGQTCATTSNTYDVAGRLASTTYPDGETVTYQYDAWGRLASIPGYVTAIRYNAAGQMLGIDYANGTSTDYTYSAQRHWLKSTEVNGPSGTLFQMSYNYDAAARVTSTTSSTHPMAALNYGYDDLGRLTSVSGGQSQTLSYNALGNITQNSAIGAYGYDSASHKHAVTSAGPSSYSYDANGNMTAGGGRSMTWNADNLLTSVTKNGVTTSNQYDYAGERVARTTPSGTRLFFSKLVELEQATWTKNYYAGSVRVASKTGSTKTFYHADHLGSTRLLTNAYGQKTQDYDYAAYGATARSSGSTGNTKLYGGHETDTDAGLVYMHARFYDAELGRFLSADSVVPEMDNPQAFNRYAYVYNNPISNADPTGHAPVVAAVAVCASVGATLGVTSMAFAISVVGAATMTVGYTTKSPLLMSIGGVLLGAASGFAFGAGFLAGPGMQGAIVSGGISLMTSPISPLDPKLKQLIGYAYMAQSFIHDYMNIDENVDKYSKEYAKDHPIKPEQAAELRRQASNMSASDRVLASDSSKWTTPQRLYGKAMENMTGGALSQGEAIALSTSGGLIGRGAGFSTNVLEFATGWMPGMRVHSVVHDAGGFLANSIGGVHTYAWAGNWLGTAATAGTFTGQIEGISKASGAFGFSIYSRMFGW